MVQREKKYYSRAADPDSTKWIGTGGYSSCKQQFQLLHERYGLRNAMDMAEDMITWKDKRRPEEGNYISWALEMDDGNADIPDRIRRQFSQRVDRVVELNAIKTLREGGLAVQQIAKVVAKLAKQVDDGDVNEKMVDQVSKLSAMTQHLLQNQGHLTRELLAGTRNVQPVNATQIGKLVINAGTRPKKLPKGDVIDAEVKELPVGNSDAA